MGEEGRKGSVSRPYPGKGLSRAIRMNILILSAGHKNRKGVNYGKMCMVRRVYA
jgi:hypothetical protein